MKLLLHEATCKTADFLIMKTGNAEESLGLNNFNFLPYSPTPAFSSPSTLRFPLSCLLSA